MIVPKGYAFAQEEELVMLSNLRQSHFNTNILSADTAGINSLLQRGEMLKLRNTDSAFQLFGMALKRSIRLHYISGIVTAMKGIGSLKRDNGAYDQASDYYIRAIRLCERLQAEYLLPGLYNEYGRMYAKQGKYKEATELYYKAIRIAERASPSVNADYIYNNLAITLMQLRRSYREILFYLNKAEQAALQQNNEELQVTVLINKGIAYNTIQAWDSSRLYFHAALTAGDNLHKSDIVHSALSNIGLTYLEQGMPDKALPYLLRADSLNPEVDNYDQNISLYTLGKAYFQRKEYKHAEKLLQEGLKLASETDRNLIVRELYLTLGKLYGATRQYEKAFRYLTDYIQINNNIAGENVTQQVSQLEVKYRTAQKDKEIAEKKLLLGQQDRAIEQKNTWISVISSGTVLLILLLIVLYRSYQHKKRSQANWIQMLQQEQELLQKEHEIGQLKAVMKGEEQERIRIGRELHDGIGGLLSAAKINLCALQRRNSQPAATEEYNNTLMLIDEATSELRKTAHNLMPEILMKSGLGEAIASFCERIQRGQELDIHVQIYGDLPRLGASFELAVYRIIQELIHNIVKHARTKSALVQLNWQEQVFSIMVEDNGIGIPAKTGSDRSGIGLNNIKERVKALNGQIDIESQPAQGTTVCIIFDHKDLFR